MATATATRNAALHAEALAAAQAAAEAVVPTPMLVTQRENPWDDTSPIVKAYRVAGGACGMASVIIRPATSSYARWLAKNEVGYRHYYGGWAVPARPDVPGALIQSSEINAAWARGYARVLRENGIEVRVETRLD
ncbi:MAG: hypothetical protein ACOYOQ_00410 [Microthrixaceae bacterium]